MPDDASQTTPPAPPTLICPGPVRQRDPPIFSGSDEYDVEDWLSIYERVSAPNKWDDATKLSYANFYLTGVASVWYHNHESDLSTWSDFKARITQVFGRPAVRKLRAEERLRSRSQQPGENFTKYIEDVVDLCKRVDPSMTESDKIRHVMKGIEDDAFQMLLSKSPRTVVEVAELCQSYDELRRQRLLTRRSSVPDASVASLAAVTNNDYLLGEIKEFIRSEVARQLSLLTAVPGPTPSLAPPLRQMLQEQVSEAIQSPRAAPPLSVPLSYAEVAARPPPSTFSAPPFAAPPRPIPPVYTTRSPASTGPWRTPDNRPVCFFCGIPGHVARLCRRRLWLQGHDQPVSSYVSPASSFSPPRDSHLPSTRNVIPSARDRRSPSPRRRSLSPMRRRPAPSEQEN